jgi:rRNA maturation protein Rpf1
LPSNTFTDALGLKMTFLAYEAAGPDISSWLHFDPLAGRLFETVPSTQSGTVTLAIEARDAMGMSATDMFNVAFAPSGAQTSTLHAAFRETAGPVDPVHGHGLIALHG